MRFLITGSFGFIATNAFEYFKEQGHQVIGIDNLSRKGSERNLERLKEKYNLVRNKDYYLIDITEAEQLEKAIIAIKPDVILHLAAQTAVTTSIELPRFDFMNNALGTFNILEAVRKYCPNCIVLYSSTNKVYGNLEKHELMVVGDFNGDERYEFEDTEAIDENEPLDFHSPYGCSKGCADQYVRDYARIYGLKTIVFRQSCIYGEWQNGSLDQGWISWLTASAIMDKPITIFGDGMQVRDILYIQDLLEAYNSAIEHIKKTSGQVYNIGGGVENTLSLIELLRYLNHELKKPLDVNFAPERPGDQKVYVSDISKALRDFGWYPKFDMNDGLDNIVNWTRQHIELFKGE